MEFSFFDYRSELVPRVTFSSSGDIMHDFVLFA